MSRGRRSAVEIIIITFTVVVAVLIVGFGVAVIVVELVNPETDTSDAVRGLTTIITSILSALLGLLAGRTLDSGDKGDDR